MKYEREFLKCNKCGNIAALLENKGPKLVCCGQEMSLLTPNTVDAAAEKHVPAAELKDGMLHVKVGAVPHPHTKEHHIAWISVAQDSMTQRIKLDEESEAAAQFQLTEGDSATVYAFCNLHGLWAADI